MANAKQVVWIMLDVETTGPVPTVHSAVHWGFATALDGSSVLRPTPTSTPSSSTGGDNVDHKANHPRWLLERKAWCVEEYNQSRDPNTWSTFWMKPANLRNWNRISKEAQPVKVVMAEIHEWLLLQYATFDVRWACKPASSDLHWLVHCLYMYGPSPDALKRAGMDLANLRATCLWTLMQAACDSAPGVTMRDVERQIFSPSLRYTHLADDDAVAQLYALLSFREQFRLVFVGTLRSSSNTGERAKTDSTNTQLVTSYKPASQRQEAADSSASAFPSVSSSFPSSSSCSSLFEPS